MGKNKQARKENRRQNKRENREYKLAKQAQRQATRVDKTTARQQGKTDRTQIRQDAKTDRKISQNQADMVAYENGVQPVNRAAGILSASGDAASGLADLAVSLSGAGVFGKDVAALNTGAGKDRNISFDADGDIDEMSDRVSPWGGGSGQGGFSMIWMALLAVVAMLFMNQRKRK